MKVKMRWTPVVMGEALARDQACKHACCHVNALCFRLQVVTASLFTWMQAVCPRRHHVQAKNYACSFQCLLGKGLNRFAGPAPLDLPSTGKVARALEFGSLHACILSSCMTSIYLIQPIKLIC